MLNEPSILRAGEGAAPPTESAETQRRAPVFAQLERSVGEVLDIRRVNYEPPEPAAIAFSGKLRVDSETAFARLDQAFGEHNFQAVLTTDDEGQHLVLAVRGLVVAKERPWWPNAALFALTVLSLLYVGAAQDAAMREADTLRLADLWRGWPYALAVILILGSHELGHYFAARRHHVRVTLPYFIPLPFGFFGTLGAFIQLREPMRNRKVLFDVGAAGPLVGFVLAVPILLIGLATSHMEPLPSDAYILEGNSLIYAGAKYLVFGEWLPNGDEDVFINQLAKAGWTGLLVTGLNLIPLGQLDGGHVVFTLLGRNARHLYIPVVGLFFLLAMLNAVWLIWTLLLFFLGRVYAVPRDNVTPLDPRRRWLAYATLAIFVLVFVPSPLQVIQP